MKSFLYRELMRHRPETPQTIVGLEIALMNYRPMERIYKGTVLSNNGYRAVLFTTNALLDALAAASDIFMDGTFSVVPRVPSFIQVYSIHIRFMDTGIPVLFALCEKRTMDVYDAIWQRVKELHPNTLQGVQTIMSDYERAAMTVARKVFPEARITGCWFHFNQAILRRWKTLGLMAAPRKILGFAMTLPLAPVDAFEEGLKIIQDEADLISTEHPAILKFTVYLRRTWLPAKEKVCVFNTPIRTNNIVESFHRVLFLRFGGIHPNIWQFLQSLGELLIDQEINIERLAEGRSVKRVRIRHNIVRDKQIAEAQVNLSSGRLSLREFLQTLCRVSQMPEENFALQDDILDDTPGHEETIDNNLLDAHTVQKPVSISHTVIENQEVDRTEPIIANVASDRHGLSRASVIANSEPDSELDITRTNLPRSRGRPPCNRGRPPCNRGRPPRSRGRPPRSRGRPPRRGRNLQRAAETFEPISQIEEAHSIEATSHHLDTLTLDGELTRSRNRGRPPKRRGRRGRFTTLSRTEEITGHTSTEQGSQQIEVLSSESDHNEENEIEAVLSDQNEMVHNEDFEDIFRTPEDDFGTIGLSDKEEDHLPFHPVSTIASSQRNRSNGTCCTCLNATAAYIFVPCGHLCICSECQKRLQDHKCPLCRKKYSYCIRAITI
ncbi:uncharacterized protein [Linepithema humile]